MNTIKLITPKNLFITLIAMATCIAGWGGAYPPPACYYYASDKSIIIFNCPECSYQMASHNIFCNPTAENTYCKLHSGSVNVFVSDWTGECYPIIVNGQFAGYACLGVNETPLGSAPSNTLSTDECLIAYSPAISSSIYAAMR